MRSIRGPSSDMLFPATVIGGVFGILGWWLGALLFENLSAEKFSEPFFILRRRVGFFKNWSVLTDFQIVVSAHWRGGNFPFKKCRYLHFRGSFSNGRVACGNKCPPFFRAHCGIFCHRMGVVHWEVANHNLFHGVSPFERK